MITISNNSNIEYTTGDTFKIIVSSDTSFLAGSVLRFQIAENNGDSVVINNNYNLSDSGDFTISLTTSETAKLVIGDYVYRITIIDADRDITTEKSGNFKVKWGAKSYQTSTMSLSASNTKALDKKLQNEIVERTEADTELDSKIEAEILLRENIDSSLQTAVDLKADKCNEQNGFVGGEFAEAGFGGAVGNTAFSQSGGFAGGAYTSANKGGAIGYNASADTGGAVGNSACTNTGGAAGNKALSDCGGAVGYCARTSDGFAGGKNAQTWLVDENMWIDAVQLGTGINQTAKTLQVYDYTMMNADGTIPEDRIPVLSELQTNVNLLSPVKDVLNVQLDVADLDGQINLTQANSPASQFGFSKPYQISAIGEASGVNVFVGVGSVTTAFTVKVFATTANIGLSGGKYNYEYMDKEIEVSLSESAWVYLDLTDIKSAFEGKELLTVGFYTTDTTVTRPFYTYYCPSSMQLSNAFIGNNSWHYYLNGGWGGNTSTSNINMIYVLFQKVNGYSSDSTDLVSAVDTNKYQPDNALRVVCLSDIHFGGTPTEITETSTSPNIYDIDRLNIITNSINSENAVKPIDFVIIAGDLLTLSGSAQGADSFKVPKLKEFKQLLIDKLDMPVFCIGGNHDGFTNEQWVSALGHNRRFSIHTDNYAFICIDVYSDQRWQIYSKTDLGYTGICPNDEAKAWVSGELQKAKTADKKVIFVWHTFYGNGMDTPGNYANHSDTYFHLLTAGNDNLEQLSCLSDITADMIDEGIITAGTTPTYAQVRDYYISLINQSDSYFATLCTQYDDIIAGCISGHSHLQYLNGSPVYCKKDINCGNFGAISRLNNSSGTYTGKSGYTFVTINGVEYADITNSAYSYKALEVTPEKLYSYTVYPEITYPTFQPSADTTTQSYAYKGSLSIDAKTRYSAADFDLKSIANMKYKALNDRIGTVSENEITTDRISDGAVSKSKLSQSLVTELQSKQAITDKGQPNGYAPLDTLGKIPNGYLYGKTVKEYGVRWSGTSSTECDRLGDAIGLSANAHLGTTDSVQNDFDSIYPWSDMKLCNIDADGNVLAYNGEPTFTKDGTNGDVMVEIPKFYYKRNKTSEGYEEWWVCSLPLDGYQLHPLFINDGTEVSKVYHSAYNVSTYTDADDNKVKVQSITGVQPTVRTTRANFRTYAQNKGANWSIEDLSCVNALQMLYMIEYSNTNSQLKLGKGASNLSYTANHKALVATDNGNFIIVSSSYKNIYNVGQRIEIGATQGTSDKSVTPRTVTAVTTDEETGTTTVSFDGSPIDIAIGDMIWNVAPLNGSCDDLNGESGYIGTSGYADTSYRGIEGFHGKLFRLIDGININDRIVYYANSTADYADGVYTGKYRAVGYTNGDASGYVSAFGYDSKAPWIMFPTAANGSSTTYVPDYYYQPTGERLLLLGGYFTYGVSSGVFCFSCAGTFSYSYLNCGAHLLIKKP